MPMVTPVTTGPQRDEKNLVNELMPGSFPEVADYGRHSGEGPVKGANRLLVPSEAEEEGAMMEPCSGIGLLRRERPFQGLESLSMLPDQLEG